MRKLLALFALTAACGTCPNHVTIITILPPANGDAGLPIDLPPKPGELGLDECKGWCGEADVLSCSYDQPGGVPTFTCVVPSMCE